MNTIEAVAHQARAIAMSQGTRSAENSSVDIMFSDGFLAIVTNPDTQRVGVSVKTSQPEGWDTVFDVDDIGSLHQWKSFVPVEGYNSWLDYLEKLAAGTETTGAKGLKFSQVNLWVTQVTCYLLLEAESLIDFVTAFDLMYSVLQDCKDFLGETQPQGDTAAPEYETRLEALQQAIAVAIAAADGKLEVRFKGGAR